MSTLQGNFGDVQLIPFGFDQLPADDEDLADLLRFGYFGDDATDPRVTFDGWLDAQAERLRRKDGAAAVWLARKVDELASMARYLKASTPGEFDERSEDAEGDRDARLRAEGYDACQAEIQGQLCLAWGHDR